MDKTLSDLLYIQYWSCSEQQACLETTGGPFQPEGVPDPVNLFGAHHLEYRKKKKKKKRFTSLSVFKYCKNIIEIYVTVAELYSEEKFFLSMDQERGVKTGSLEINGINYYE